jgi:hypothetical protein
MTVDAEVGNNNANTNEDATTATANATVTAALTEVVRLKERVAQLEEEIVSLRRGGAVNAIDI